MKIYDLPYDFNSIPPLSEETMKYHYNILYKGYVNNYNLTLENLAKARENNDYTNIKCLEKNLSFYGAGAYLHQLFFENITPKQTVMSDKLKQKIIKNFGNIENFYNQFINNIVNIEGPGWGLLGYSKELDKLMILQAENHQKQTIWDFKVILAIDMWEHAYYLDYKTDKKEYVTKLFEYINWDIIEKRLLIK